MSFMITCKEATELAGKKSVGKLGFMDMLKLRFHMAVCAMCNVMAKQMEVVRKGAEIFGKQPPPVDVPAGMSDRLADRLKNEDGFPKAG